jgi:hypothetical protein
MCVFGAFYLLALLFFVFSTSALVLSFSCGGLRAGMVGWEGYSRKDVDGSVYCHFV